MFSRGVGAPEFIKEHLDIKRALIKLKKQMFVINLRFLQSDFYLFWWFFLIRPDGGVHSRSSSSSSPSWFWLCRASLAAPRLGGSPAPSGSRHGTPGCRSGRGKGHRPSTPRTHHTSLCLAAEAEKLQCKLRVKNILGCAKGSGSSF